MEQCSNAYMNRVIVSENHCDIVIVRSVEMKCKIWSHDQLLTGNLELCMFHTNAQFVPLLKRMPVM